MKKLILIPFICAYLSVFAQKPISQIDITLVKGMPNLPQPYKMKDWKDVAKKQDDLLFDFKKKGTFLPLIWWDKTQTNFPIRSFGLPSYVGSLRNMSKGPHYESLPTMGSVLGASLVGIDKGNYKGVDFVSMLKQFYNVSNGANLIMNDVNRQPGQTFWYEIWPGMAFHMLVDLYPEHEEIARISKLNAENWMTAIENLSIGRDFPDFNFTAYDFEKKKGFYNNRWHEPDAAAGLAWLQFSSWKKWGDPKFLEASKSCMAFLQNLPKEKGPFYEIMMPYGAYLAVRMNAELGTSYDELKMLDWCFDGDNSDRDGWGVMSESWNKYDVHGLVGQKKAEQYAFAMNTFSHAAALVPIVKYNPAYSRTIGKWVLNLANASRLFYANELPRNQQTSAAWAGDPDHVICYEGVRKDLDHGNYFQNLKGVLANEGPYALGDQVKQFTSLTDLCPYGSAWVGMLAAIVDTTNVEGILKLDCNATDFYASKEFPSYLFFNPYKENKVVKFNVGPKTMDIYDRVSKQMISKNSKGHINLEIKGDAALSLVLVPSGSKTKIKGNRLVTGNGIIDYQYKH